MTLNIDNNNKLTLLPNYNIKLNLHLFCAYWAIDIVSVLVMMLLTYFVTNSTSESAVSAPLQRIGANKVP